MLQYSAESERWPTWRRPSTPSARVVHSAGEAPKVGPRIGRNGLLALCLGLLLALVVVFLADALDTRVRSVDAIRETLGLSSSRTFG